MAAIEIYWRYARDYYEEDDVREYIRASKEEQKKLDLLEKDDQLFIDWYNREKGNMRLLFINRFPRLLWGRDCNTFEEAMALIKHSIITHVPAQFINPETYKEYPCHPRDLVEVLPFEQVLLDPSIPKDHHLLKNPGITWKYIEDNLMMFLRSNDIVNLSRCPAVTWQNIKDHPEVLWDSCGVTQNPNITEKIIRENPDEDWWWSYVSCSTIEFVIEYAYRGLSMEDVCGAIRFTSEDIRNNPHVPWDFKALSCNDHLEFRTVLELLNEPWDWGCLTCNPCVTPEIIRAHPELPWSFRWLHEINRLKFDLVEEFIDRDWDFDLLSKHPNLDIEVVASHLHIEWNWAYISMNPNVTQEIILKHPDLPWEEKTLVFNPNVKWDMIKNKVQKKYLSNYTFNPNVDLDTILNNPDIVWTLQGLTFNMFTQDRYYMRRIRAEITKDRRRDVKQTFTGLKVLAPVLEDIVTSYVEYD